LSVDPSLTPALEDYLKAIYVLQKVMPMVKVIDIAQHLNVTMPSVSTSMGRLAKLNCIKYHKRWNIQLTEKGERIARSVNRRHEELYSFYHDVLGEEKDIARESACRVEHVLAPSIIEKIIRLNQWLQNLPENEKSSFEEEVQNSGVTGVEGNGFRNQRRRRCSTEIVGNGNCGGSQNRSD